jgi:hypothetical protein
MATPFDQGQKEVRGEASKKRGQIASQINRLFVIEGRRVEEVRPFQPRATKKNRPIAELERVRCKTDNQTV